MTKPLSWFQYWLDALVSPAIIAGLVLVELYVGPSLAFVAAVAIGIAAWTLIEYCVHRFLFHWLAFKEAHDEHHKRPDDLIGWPSHWTVLGEAVLIAFCVGTLGVHTGGGLATGLILGYCAYMAVHHAVHYRVLGAGTWLHGAQLRHRGHHYADTNENFGVVTTLWDRAFGTYKAAV